MRALAAAALLALATPLAASAEPRPIRHDLRADAAITAAGVALYLGAELLKQDLAPSSCRVCEPNALDADVRDALVWRRDDRAKRGSDVLALALPAGVLAHQLLAAGAAGDGREGWVDGLVVLEAAVLAMDLNQLVKFSVGRQRPFVRYGNFDVPDRVPDEDDNLSFYSGHTTFTFALAAAAGTVSDLRGYRSAPWVWGVGMSLAASTAYLRIAADRHYLTDVLAGAVTGTVAGIVLPRVLHGRERGGEPSPISVTPFPIGLAFVF